MAFFNPHKKWEALKKEKSISDEYSELVNGFFVETTQTWWGWFLSFIPWTEANDVRLALSRTIDNAKISLPEIIPTHRQTEKQEVQDSHEEKEAPNTAKPTHSDDPGLHLDWEDLLYLHQHKVGFQRVSTPGQLRFKKEFGGREDMVALGDFAYCGQSSRESAYDSFFQQHNHGEVLKQLDNGGFRNISTTKDLAVQKALIQCMQHFLRDFIQKSHTMYRYPGFVMVNSKTQRSAAQYGNSPLGKYSQVHFKTKDILHSMSSWSKGNAELTASQTYKNIIMRIKELRTAEERSKQTPGLKR